MEIPDTIANRTAILDAIQRMSELDLPKEGALAAATYLRGGTVDGCTALMRRYNGKWCVNAISSQRFEDDEPRIEEDLSGWKP